MMLGEIALDPTVYQRHRLHAQEKIWAETNCYVDIWIELLHAWGLEPLAALPFTVTIDFEGDQWTFFKFPHSDLFDLFGIDVQELAIWRPLEVHIEEQIALGRPLLIELDSFYLPDTAGTAYRQAHVKSTVAATEIDIAQRRLGYFHGQGFYHLYEDDFVNVLRMTGQELPSMLPPYAEIVKRQTYDQPTSEQLVAGSLRLLRYHLRRLPKGNPFVKFKQRLVIDLQWLSGAPIEMFHQYSFATLRQFGACYECTATYLQWLAEHDVLGLDQSIADFTSISNAAKTMQFQLARSMARKRALDMAPLDEMAAMWQATTEQLKSCLF
jgi:hypothetical protein